MKRLLGAVVGLSLVLVASVSYADDLATINQARRAYGKGQFQKAIDLYSSVPKDSDFWVRAIEERSHAFGKSKQYNKAIGDFTTLMNPVFEDSATPELYFTAALTYFKLCQYKKVYEVLEKFKTKMKPRVVALTGVANSKSRARLLEIAEQMKGADFSSLDYAKNIGELPLLFHRDRQVRNALREGTVNGREAYLKRVAVLAEEDLQQLRGNLNRLQLIEAEVMQRYHRLTGSGGSDRARQGSIDSKHDQLVFPYDGEVWLDELDAYQVRAEVCPDLQKGAHL